MKNKRIYNNLHILSISYRSDHLINNFIKQFNKEFRITLVENSNNFLLKKQLEKKYKNLNVIISGKNLGFGKAFNLGIKSINSKYKYLLHVNPDAKINGKNINKLFKFLDENKSAAIVSPREILKRKNKVNKKKINFIEVETIKGFVMMLNIKNCKKTNFFDENFFLYMEETDFCKRLKFLNKKIYLLETAEAEHLGGKSHNPKFNFNMELQRNWHFMWSLYYFHKKHYGLYSALRVTIRKFISSFFKKYFYLIINNKKKHLIYKYRFDGLLSSYLNKKSFLRIF
jgi:GT2 family glycosyltransferase